jgi:hypothetical protein
MKDCLDDFKNRVEEVEIFFNLVATFDKVETHKNTLINLPYGENFIIDSNLQKILKASCYLILYNLIESTVRNGIVAIYDAIHDDGLIFNDLNDKIKAIWLDHKSEPFLNKTITKKTVIKNIKNILESVIQESEISFDENKLATFISGNLNAKKIDEIIQQYGFFSRINLNSDRIGYILDHIVKMRCDLAHGNKSFRWASSGIVMHEIIDIKNDTIKFLGNLLEDINKYIEQKKYKRSM